MNPLRQKADWWLSGDDGKGGIGNNGSMGMKFLFCCDENV